MGVFIAVLDRDGFAAKSGKFQVQDRILACNGCDFTKGMPNDRVEEIFAELVEEPLLRMAIGRGGFKGSPQLARDPGGEEGAGPDTPGDKEVGVAPVDSETSLSAPGPENGEEKWVESPLAARPTIKSFGMLERWPYR